MSATLGRLFFRVTRPMAIRPALQATIRSNALARLPLAANRSTKAAEKVETPKTTAKSKAAGKATTTKAATKAATTRKVAAAKTKKSAAAAAPKKSAVKAKAQPKKAVRKLTDEQKKAKLAKLQEQKAVDKRRMKKELALKPPFPTLGQVSGYNVFLSELTRGVEGKKQITSEIASQWKTLPEAEKTRFNDMAKAMNEKKEATYKAWIESHTLEEIKIANQARRWLRDNGVRGYNHILKDHRKPKMPIRPFFAYYSQNRDLLEGATVTDKSKSAGARWKAMSDAEKKPYVDLAARDAERYAAELKAVSA